MRKYYICILLLMPVSVHAQLDTSAVLNRLAGDLRQIKDASYEYTMDAFFPNGEKSQLKGSAYLNTEEKIFYNDCSEFTMLYTPHWFYKADHKNKKVIVIDLTKEKDKNTRAAREKQIFQSGALNTFLDSVLLRNSSIKQLSYNGTTYEMSLGFPVSSIVRTMSVTYDTLQHLPSACAMTTSQLWQKTVTGNQYLRMSMSFTKFNRPQDISIYEEGVYFSHKNDKITLKKYCNYTITTKYNP